MAGFQSSSVAQQGPPQQTIEFTRAPQARVVEDLLEDHFSEQAALAHSGAAAVDVADLGAEAARNLPRAARLTSILFDQAEETNVDVDSLAKGDLIEDHLMIGRVEPRALWFEGGIGPVRVPRAASDLAQPGWSASAVLARVRNAWQLVEIGDVYP
jgi:hypothetical protein